MSAPPASLSPEERADFTGALLLRVYEIHNEVIEETGGMAGLREPSLLHAAVARPFATNGGADLYPSDFEKAAALFHSLIKSHPFLDGTKRTAFASTVYFLAHFGHPAPEEFAMDEVIGFCISIAEENMRVSQGESVRPREISEIAEWFRSLWEVGRRQA